MDLAQGFLSQEPKWTTSILFVSCVFASASQVEYFVLNESI